MSPGDLVSVGLFPLPNVVLFPGMRISLHVFEPRYSRLVHDALTRDGLLAVPRLRPGYEAQYYGTPEVHAVYGVGRIAEHARLEDGRYDIAVEGLVRVRLVEETSDSPYRVATAQVLADRLSPNGPNPHSLHGELKKLLEELRPFWSEAGVELELVATRAPDLSSCTDALAGILASSDARQALLEELDPKERALRLLARLHELLLQVRTPTPKTRAN